MQKSGLDSAACDANLEVLTVFSSSFFSLHPLLFVLDCSIKYFQQENKNHIEELDMFGVNLTTKLKDIREPVKNVLADFAR